MNSPEIEQLNSLLRGEVTSVETYTQALQKIDDDKIASQLELSRASHLHRAEALKLKITELGGKASEGTGVWGAFAKLVEGGATLFGAKAAIDALEQGEDHGKSDYRHALEKCTGEVKTFIQSELFPEQEKTHKVLSELKHTLH